MSLIITHTLDDLRPNTTQQQANAAGAPGSKVVAFSFTHVSFACQQVMWVASTDTSHQEFGENLDFDMFGCPPCQSPRAQQHLWPVF